VRAARTLQSLPRSLPAPRAVCRRIRVNEHQLDRAERTEKSTSSFTTPSIPASSSSRIHPRWNHRLRSRTPHRRPNQRPHQLPRINRNRRATAIATASSAFRAIPSSVTGIASLPSFRCSTAFSEEVRVNGSANRRGVCPNLSQ